MPPHSVMKGAEPWGADGDDVGVLVLHGFTGSPQTVRSWAESIAADGRTVLLPRLPGHGTHVDDLQRATSKEWVAEAEMSLMGLRERCRSIFICSISFGGALTLDLAGRFPEVIDGMVLVNPSVYSTDPRVKLAPVLGLVPLKVKGVANDIADPSARELGYDKVPTKAAAQVIAYQAGVKARLGRVRAPALVFTSRQDHVVHPDNSGYILEHISSTDKEQVWLERSYHVATLDHDKDEIFERTNAFIKERMK